MSSIPKELKYTKSHEWVKPGNGSVRVGMTDYAQESMGDLVYIELPQVGDVFSKGESMAVVESVKATSDIYAPLSGRIAAINEELEDNPGLVNESCYDAWLVEMENTDGNGLLTPEEYEEAVLGELEDE